MHIKIRVIAGAGTFKNLFKGIIACQIRKGESRYKENNPPDTFYLKVRRNKYNYKQIKWCPIFWCPPKWQYRIEKRMSPLVINLDK